MAPPRPPPPLIDDVLAEIFLRLPPDEPEHLFRAALVCKPWLRILCDPGFLRRYRAFHGAPPLLGLLHRLQVLEGFPRPRFASTTSMPDFPHPGSDGDRTRPLDCRHGRALIIMPWEKTTRLLVWDPVTGDRHAMPWPDMDPFLIESAAVLCATDGCDHLDCHGGPFRVIFMATHESKDTIFARMYSSEKGEWGVPVSFDNSYEPFVRHMWEGRAYDPIYTPYLQPRRGTLVGDGIYFTVRFANAIIKYDWGNNGLSIMDPPSLDAYHITLMAMDPPSLDAYHISLMAMDSGTLGFACILGSSLHMWLRKVDTEEPAGWVPYRVIDLQNMIPVANPEEKLVVVGFAEGVGVVFVSTYVGLFVTRDAKLFMIKLSSGKAKKVEDSGVYFSVLPYMSFYTPDRGRLLSLARAH